MKKLFALLFYVFFTHAVHSKTRICSSDTTLDVELYTNGTVNFLPPSNDLPNKSASFIKKRQQTAQNETKISSKKADKGKSHDLIQIEVAKNTNLKFQTATGAVSLTDIEGKVKGHVESGAITLTRGNGKVELITEKGNVNVTEAESSGFVMTRSGDVVLQDVNGNIKAIASNGKVLVKTTSGFFTKRKARAIVLDYDQADMEIADTPEGGEFKTRKGNISVLNALKSISIKTNEGDLNVSSLTSGIRASTGKGKVTLQIANNNNADEPIIIEAQEGDVELLVPKNFSANFNISLTQTKNLSTPNQVSSFIDLGTITPQEIRDVKSKELFGREIQINHVVKKAGRLVQIRVINGNIFIRNNK